MIRDYSLILALTLLVLLASQAIAEEISFGGHIKYQPSLTYYQSGDALAALGPDLVSATELDLRTYAEARVSSFDFSIHAELLGLGSNGLDAKRDLQDLSPAGLRRDLLLDDDRRLLDITAEILDEKHAVAVLRLDRLSAGWSNDWAVLRLGRQSISWGNGLVFSVFDLFNPFSPIEIDKDYKTGDDMFYSQGLLPWGGDIQGLVVGRRDPETDSIMARESSFAAKWHERISALEVDLDLLASRHYGENVFGLGLSRNLWEAVVRGDLSVTELEGGSQPLSLVLSVDRSWVILDTNTYAYLEYYRNGVGVGDGDYREISPELVTRLARGEVFVLGRDYLAGGTQVELSPRINWYNSLIFNLHDESGVIQQRLIFDILQDFLLTVGANLFYGPRGSESGGIPTGQETYLAPGNSFYFRLAYYF